MDEGVLIPLIFFSFLTAVILGPIYFRYRARRETAEIVGRAIERGAPLDAEALERLGLGRALSDIDTDPKKSPAESRRHSLQAGVFILCIAIGLAAAGYYGGAALDEPEMQAGMTVGAIVTGSVGLGFLISALFAGSDKKRSDANTPPSGLDKV